MSICTVYRLCIWLPILVPALVILVAKAFTLNLADGLVWEVLAYSLVYGGLPYAALALWASWWIGGRSEGEIRRLMFRAPLLMVAVFVPVALVAGLAVGAPGPFAAVAVLGTLIILPLGYLYVGVSFLARRSFGPAPPLTNRDSL
jgi:hypothetical protein